MPALSDEELRDYHVGMDHESAWRAYAGMIETKQERLERILELIPESIADELLSYFKSIQNGLDGDYE
jgi:hypothetical protein